LTGFLTTGDAMLIGYARVSTDDQKLDLQRESLRAAGFDKINEDRMSGAKAVFPWKARRAFSGNTSHGCSQSAPSTRSLSTIFSIRLR
jgi:hypothetical protein